MTMEASADYIIMEPPEVSRLHSNNESNRGDARSICGDDVNCLIDRRKILEMHEQSSYTASVYISIILAFYSFGMIVLLLHFVKQKYGQVSLYDIYLEVCPSRWTGIDPVPDPRSAVDDEEDDDEEAPETLARRATASVRRYRFDFFFGSEKRGIASVEQSRKSSSASSVDASREGRDRRRRNRKKMTRRSSHSRHNDADVSSVASPGVVLTTTINDSTSLGYFKTSPIAVVTFPISEEFETSTTTMTLMTTSLNTSFKDVKSDRSIGMSTLASVDKICSLKIDEAASINENLDSEEDDDQRKSKSTKETIL